MRPQLLASVCLLVVICFFADGVRAVSSYEITELGTLGGTMSKAYGINDSGLVVGEAQTVSGSYHAFLWQDGVMADLGTLGGQSSAALAINSGGQVVGWAETGDTDPYGDPVRHAFLWDDGVMSDLGTLGGESSTAYAINDLGHVVGSAWTGTTWTNGRPVKHPFLWNTGTMTDLGTFGGPDGCAMGINNSGEIVGHAALSPDQDYYLNHAFLWRDSAMTDLGTLGGPNSAAYGINESCYVVGFAHLYTDPPLSHAFLWAGGIMADLGIHAGEYELHSASTAINDAGIFVGWHSPYICYGFLCEGGVVYNLTDLIPPDSGWSYVARPSDINNHGQIVGTSFLTGVATRAYLLTPVPEPATLGLLLLGVSSIALRNKRRH